MLTQSAIQSFFHADYSGTQQLLKQILEPIFGDYELGYDEITKSQTIKEKAKAAHIKTIKHVATFDAEGLQIKLFDVTLENNCHIHVARKNIQQLVREYVEKFEGAFIVFHYEHPEGRSWRLSYLEKRQNNAASTNAKRYTYLCGKDYPCRTIAERFYALQSQDLNAINLEKAFSVEALSDEFFTEYTAQYNNICKYIYENRKDTARFGEEFADCEDKFIRDYVKKMMGRITFLHFLQKKGWMGVPQNAAWGQGDVNFMYHLFEYASEEQKEDFLDQVLEPIFFDCLNAPREKDLYDTHVAKIGTVRIPYLNGGLFEKDEIDEPQSTLPKEIFENLLDFYARFNFTIDENDPLDAEVGVDPEMLGKIFENLLEDNKDKGAFYTPKEIVNYMCKESLIAYLVSEAQQASEVNKQRQENFDAAIRALVEDPEMTVSRIKRYDEKQLEVLSKALMEVKICDPAIGSGAFPMGLLNLLFKCRNAVNNALGQSVPPAELKKDIIRNNIYGVDIEKGAIDIARLRFWLSIVVDLEEPEALPNFDYKFMQGNSLLEQFAGVDLSDMFATKATEGKGSGVQLISFDEVTTSQSILQERLRHYFGMRTGEDKHLLREKVNQAVADLISAKVNEAPELVSQLQDLDVSANDQFFLWHTWFAEVFNRPSKQGFDIVIGNPPWGADLSSESKTVLKNIFPEIDSSTPNSYAYFIGWGIRHYTASLNLVLPDSILIKDFKKTRELISPKTKEVIWYQNTSVPRDKRMFRDVEHDICIIHLDNGTHRKVHLQTNNYENGEYVAYDTIEDKSIVFRKEFDFVFNLKASGSDWRILSKLIKSPAIGNIAQCHEGIHSGNVREKLFIKGNSGRPDLKPMFYGGRAGDIIRPYVSYMNNWYVDYRESIIDDSKKEYASLRDERLFYLPKIYITRTGNPFKAFYDRDSYASNNFFSLQMKDYSRNNEDELLFLLPFINSKICQYFIRTFAAPRLGNAFIETKIIHLLKFPVPNCSIEQKKEIVKMVSDIVKAKKIDINSDISDLEKTLYNTIYNLYNLTADEIKLIEQA